MPAHGGGIELGGLEDPSRLEDPSALNQQPVTVGVCTLQTYSDVPTPYASTYLGVYVGGLSQTLSERKLSYDNYNVVIAHSLSLHAWWMPRVIESKLHVGLSCIWVCEVFFYILSIKVGASQLSQA